jgi:N-acylneuraminate cytidylyltransferase
MGSLCIITARGGSKRIPRKNIKDFLGKPIIAYSIQAAIDSGLFDEVMVSTDDSEIAEIAKSFGANIPFMRSEKNSDDFSGTFDVIHEVLREYIKQGREYDYLCCLYPTAPFVSGKLLKNGFKLMKAHDYNTVFPVCSFSAPIQRAIKWDGIKVSMFQPEFINKRSQDLEPAYHDAGQFYWLNISRMMDEPQLFTSNSGVLILDETELQDIDYPTDWKLAELKYKMINDIS